MVVPTGSNAGRYPLNTCSGGIFIRVSDHGIWFGGARWRGLRTRCVTITENVPYFLGGKRSGESPSVDRTSCGPIDAPRGPGQTGVESSHAGKIAATVDARAEPRRGSG